jgi:hypothetical protein
MLPFNLLVKGEKAQKNARQNEDQTLYNMM